MGETIFTIKYEPWECSDGCCSGSSDSLYINGEFVKTYAELDFEQERAIKRLLDCINSKQEKFTLIYTVDLFEPGLLLDAIYLNDTLLISSFCDNEIYEDILKFLGIEYETEDYTYDTDLWKEGIFKLIEVDY